MAAGHALVVGRERAVGKRFDAVVFSRPDVLYDFPFGPHCEYDAGTWYAGGKGAPDNFWILPRAAAGGAPANPRVPIAARAMDAAWLVREAEARLGLDAYDVWRKRAHQADLYAPRVKLVRMLVRVREREAARPRWKSYCV